MSEVRLIRARVWRELCKTAFEPLPEDVQRRATALLTTLQSRHVGITPELAATLAAVLGASSERYPDPWGQVIQRLRDELAGLSGTRYTSEFAELLHLRASVPYTTFKIVQPLIDAACQQTLKTVYLFSEDDNIPNAVTATEYADYHTALTRALVEMTDEENPILPAAFWQDRALMLNAAANARYQARRNRELVRLSRVESVAMSPEDVPHIDSNLMDSRLFLALNVKPRYRQEQQHRVHVPDKTHLKSDRHRDAGVDGVTVSRRMEDLQHMLMTEYIYPDAIRYDRMFNSGYWILKPPPKAYKLRDVLLVAMLPGVFLDTAVGVFLKTCWFHFTLHLAAALRANGLANSEFRWIEGDGLYRVRVQNLPLAALGDMPIRTHDSPAYRQYYLKALAWLPEYLNTNARFRAFTENAAPRDDDNNALGWWLRQAWREQTRTLTGASRRNRLESYLREFGYVHVMTFLPQAMRADKDRDGFVNIGDITGETLSRTRLQRAFGVRQSQISITWTPQTLGGTWGYEGRARGIGNTDKLDLELFAAALVDVWLDDFMMQINYA